MAESYVQIEKGLGPEGRIAVVRFDRGDGVNALSPEALRQLTAAARGFEDTDMALLAAATRYRLGKLLGGARGRANVAAAVRYMDEEGIENPARMAAMYAPIWR